MGLQGIFDAVGTELAALHSGVGWRLGAQYLAGNEDAVPRVVWVRQPGRYDAPGATPGHNPGAIATRIAVVAIHVWAASFDDAETLADDVIVALRRASQGAFSLTTDQWVSDDGQISSDGALYVFFVEFFTAVTERARPVVKPLTGEQTPVIQFPGGNVSNP